MNRAGLLLMVWGLSGWVFVDAASKVELELAVPQFSAGADANLTKLYGAMPWLPCTVKNEAFATSKANRQVPAATTKPSDLLQFDIAVDNEDKQNNVTGAAGSDGVMDNDLFVFLINPNASGDKVAFDEAMAVGIGAAIMHTQLWAVTSPSFNNNPAALQPFANAASVDPASAVFKTADSFIGTSLKTTLLGGPMFFDKTAISQGLSQGPWSIVAMLINARFAKTMTAGQLQNPQYWEAWDVKPFILGTPFYLPNKGTGLSGANGRCR